MTIFSLAKAMIFLDGEIVWSNSPQQLLHHSVAPLLVLFFVAARCHGSNLQLLAFHCATPYAPHPVVLPPWDLVLPPRRRGPPNSIPYAARSSFARPRR